MENKLAKQYLANLSHFSTAVLRTIPEVNRNEAAI
jgi:hypothetical protein